MGKKLYLTITMVSIQTFQLTVVLVQQLRDRHVMMTYSTCKAPKCFLTAVNMVRHILFYS